MTFTVIVMDLLSLVITMSLLRVIGY